MKTFARSLYERHQTQHHRRYALHYKIWPKRDPNKNYFQVPNEVFHIGLSYPEIYLLSLEGTETYQCYPSYKTIGKALGMCENTVSKYVRSLEEKGLIRIEPTMLRSKDGRSFNGKCPLDVIFVEKNTSSVCVCGQEYASRLKHRVDFFTFLRYNLLKWGVYGGGSYD